jgi:hypothetical protein
MPLLSSPTLKLALSTAAAVLLSFASRPAHAEAPVTLLRTVYLPEIIGDFDHFAVDLKRNHIFVSAEVHHSVEMFDLRTGEHLRSLSGYKTPHTLAFDAKKDELMVCDGGDSALDLVDPTDFHRIERIPLIDGSATGKGDSPDAGYYDAQTRLLYIGNGGVSANLPNSTISVFSPDEDKIIANIDIPGNNVESMVVDDAHHRLYVNIRDKQQIGVVDLEAKKVIDTWTVDGMVKNTAMAMDKATGRLFVAGRNPAILYILDVTTGKVVAQMPCVNINDDMSFDPASKRIYVSGLGGLSVFHEDTPDHYTELLNLPTNGGKTSEYVPSLHRFFVIHPKTDVDVAALLVYQVNP